MRALIIVAGACLAVAACEPKNKDVVPANGDEGNSVVIVNDESPDANATTEVTPDPACGTDEHCQKN